MILDVCVFLVLLSFFLVPHGQELFTWRISGKNPALILSSGISFFFFLLAPSINEFCFLYSVFLLSSSKVNATELSQVVLIFPVMLL